MSSKLTKFKLYYEYQSTLKDIRKSLKVRTKAD